MKESLNKYKDHLLARGQSLVYYNFIKKFLEYCKTKKISYKNITQENITQFFTDNNYSLNSKNNFIKSGRSYGEFLEIPKEQNEWNKIRLMKVERKIPDYLTENELREAIKYLITYHSNNIGISKIEALLNFLFYTGIRKGEILNLKRKEFNLENYSVKIWGEKSKKDRIVYFPKNIKKKIETYFNSEIERINAFNITLAQINYLPKMISKYLGRKITVHLFRHSGARDMIRKGIPIGIVSKLLGHSSITTTLIYTDPDQKMIEEMYMEKMK